MAASTVFIPRLYLLSPRPRWTGQRAAPVRQRSEVRGQRSGRGNEQVEHAGVHGLEHLLRYCARPPFALERLSVIRDADGRVARIRYVMPRHKAANWVGPGRKRKSTQPGSNGVIELSPFEFLDRLADLIPQPRKHRHRYHGVFAPNHPLRPAVTALAVGNVGKRRDATTGGRADGRHAAEGCCNSHEKPRSHDTSRIAWAKLMARVGEEFPLQCPACGGDIRLISFITEPGPIRKILTHLGEPLEPPPISPAREIGRAHV